METAELVASRSSRALYSFDDVVGDGSTSAEEDITATDRASATVVDR